MYSSQTHAVRVYVIAPSMICWGLERLVQTAHPRMELAGSATKVDALAMEHAPCDVVVILMDAEEDLHQLVWLQAGSQAKCLVVTGSHGTVLCDKAVLAGARGVIHTSDSPQSLLKAIEKIDDGELWIDRGATSRIFLEMARQKAAEGNDPETTKISTLTRRERQTIAAFAGDAAVPAREIAKRLCISEHTLRNHLTSIYNKLDVSNRLDLYAYATRHGLTEVH